MVQSHKDEGYNHMIQQYGIAYCSPYSEQHNAKLLYNNPIAQVSSLTTNAIFYRPHWVTYLSASDIMWQIHINNEPE
jgi:hypothetical protein